MRETCKPYKKEYETMQIFLKFHRQNRLCTFSKHTNTEDYKGFCILNCSAANSPANSSDKRRHRVEGKIRCRFFYVIVKIPPAMQGELLLAHTKWECKYHIFFAMIFSITHHCANFTKAGFCFIWRYRLRRNPKQTFRVITWNTTDSENLWRPEV